MKSWTYKNELRLYKRMLYAFSFTTFSSMLCGIDALLGNLSITFNVLLVILGDIIMISWIFLAFPGSQIRSHLFTINSVARICSAIGLFFLVFAMIGQAHLLRWFLYLAALPYLIVGGISWIIYFYKKAE